MPIFPLAQNKHPSARVWPSPGGDFPITDRLLKMIGEGNEVKIVFSGEKGCILKGSVAARS
jgi:hypothetical protein